VNVYLSFIGIAGDTVSACGIVSITAAEDYAAIKYVDATALPSIGTIKLTCPYALYRHVRLLP
jgi:hypothetical protein